MRPSVIFVICGGIVNATLYSISRVAGDISFSAPRGIVSSTDGSVYVSDTGNNKILVYNAITSTTSFVTSGTFPPTFNQLSGIAMGRDNELIFADSGNNLIRGILTGLEPITIITIGLLANPNFNNPEGVAVDKDGNIYVADTQNHLIRKITYSTNGYSTSTVSNIAGSGRGSADGQAGSAKFDGPRGIAVNDNGTIFVSDTNNNCIRIVNASGWVSTYAGGNNAGFVDGQGIEAAFQSPVGIATDREGNIYVADNGNQRIRKINATGYVSTIAGGGDLVGSAVLGLQSAINSPVGISVAVDGTILLTDSNFIKRLSEFEVAGIQLLAAQTLSITFQTSIPLYNLITVTVGPYSCDTVLAISTEAINCQLPLGIGVHIPTIELNGFDLGNTVPMQFPSPAINSIQPTMFFGKMSLSILGSNFGNVPSDVEVFLDFLDSPTESFKCSTPTWMKSEEIVCTIPEGLPVGNCLVIVNVGSQNSTTAIVGSNLAFPTISEIFLSPISSSLNTADSQIIADNQLTADSTILDIAKRQIAKISYTLSIVGQGFSNSGWPLDIIIRDSACSNPSIVNNTLITCFAPEGYGLATPLIRIAGVEIMNFLSFSYFSPQILSISPLTIYTGGEEELQIWGSYFGSSFPIDYIKLKNDISDTVVDCSDPERVADYLRCTVSTTILAGRYLVIVSIGGSESTDLVYFEVLEPPPPQSFDVTSFGIQASIQPFVEIRLNATTVFSDISYAITSRPLNGSISLADGGEAINFAATNVIVPPILYYQPDEYFSGTEIFEYQAISRGISSNTSTVTVFIEFTNQPPRFTASALSLVLDESASTYTIDMLSLIDDRDEKQNFTFKFEKKPTRGNWRFKEAEITDFDMLVLDVQASNILEMDLDGNGGENPYFDISGTVTDSYGLTTPNSIEIKGSVECSFSNSLNTWSTGAICKPCPNGAICSNTGRDPITNAFGYYAVETTLNGQTTLVFLQCAPPQACPAREFKFGVQKCQAGYNGTRCGTCAQGYYTYGSVCEQCPDLKLSPVTMGLIAFVVLVLVLYLAYKMSKMDVGFIGVVYTYFQALSAFYGLNLSWPPLVIRFLGFLSIFSLNIDVVTFLLMEVAPECFKVTSPGDSFEFKYYSTLSIPICIIGTGIVVYVLYCLAAAYVPQLSDRRSKNAQHNNLKRSSTLLSQILAAMLLSMKFLFLTLATTILSIFNCSYDSANSEYYFEPAPSRFCYIQSWWWALLPVSIVSFLVYIVGTIIISTLVDVKAGNIRAKRKNASVDGKLSFIPFMERLLLDMTETEFPIYKQEYLYWDAIIMIRKLLLGIVINFATKIPQTQCVLLIMIFMISLIIQNKKKPYYKDKINDLEETSLVSGSMVLLVGLIASAKESNDQVFVFFLGLMIICFICGSGILMCWNIIYHWYLAGVEAKNMMGKKLRKSIGSLNDIANRVSGSKQVDVMQIAPHPVATAPFDGEVLSDPLEAGEQLASNSPNIDNISIQASERPL